jgi:exo-beta-1,3-glucanase (GH17 family)
MVANSTWIAPPAPMTSSSCSEDETIKTSIYTPSSIYVKPSAPPAAPSSSKPAEVYTPPAAPSSSKPAEAYTPPAPVKESSKEMPAYTPAPPMESSKAVPAYTPAPAPSKPVESPKPAPASSKAADKPKPSGGYSSGGRIVTNDKSEGEIKSDIKQISEMGFTTIRSYSTDCGVFSYVVPECSKYGLKIIYGIFLEGAGKGPFSNYANQQLDEIKNKAPKDSVAMVIVGNECMFNNNCAPTELASYIDYVRTTLHGAGFPTDIAITTTEPVNVWEEKGAALCDHIDVFAVQVHPYFTSSVTADMAGDFAAQQLEQAAKVCPGAASKGKYITEIGWPSEGQNNGMAVASKEAQKIAMKKIQDKVGSESCLFSFQNDGWKHPGELGVEQFFGCADALN